VRSPSGTLCGSPGGRERGILCRSPGSGPIGFLVGNRFGAAVGGPVNVKRSPFSMKERKPNCTIIEGIVALSL